MYEGELSGYGYGDEDKVWSMKKANPTAASEQANIHRLLIKKAKNNREYKKYHEIVGTLILNYYKRFGNLEQAMAIVYSLLEESDSVESMIAHYNAMLAQEKMENGAAVDDQARSRIANTLHSDYRKRFGVKKGDAYNVLVLQSWLNKVENVNELAILMDSILTVRDKIGNSWDYEVHIIPLLLEKAFTPTALVDYSAATTNLVIGLSKRLDDSYLAVMTAVKILEYADSSKVIKAYIRDMLKDANKRLEQCNNELAMLNMSQISKMTKVMRIRDLREEISGINKAMEELTSGLDPKELQLEGSKR